MTAAGARALGWSEIDVLLISGDAYVDHPSFGAALIGRLLISFGLRVGIIAQPDWKSEDSLKIFGRPRLACAVTSGNIDSMVNIYTAGRRLRKDDMYSPGGKTGLRPPRACAVYSQLAKKAFPGIPVVLGGIEASLRRVAHYDYWQDRIKPSILTDSKADILVYGMGERAVLEIFRSLAGKGVIPSGVRGTTVLAGAKASGPEALAGRIGLPSWEDAQKRPDAMLESVITVEREMNPWSGKPLFQLYGDRALLVEPPAEPLSPEEMDAVYSLPYSKAPHPSYREPIPAFEVAANSVTVVRGCPGGCAFCGLVSHQGHWVVSRTPGSVTGEAGRMAARKGFTGVISDLGGPAGNIYGHKSRNPEICAKCRRPSCLFPEICQNYNPDGRPLMALLDKVMAVPGVRKLFISSGIRLDLAVMQPELSAKIVRNHVPGHLKVAPEHLHPDVVRLMRKNKPEYFYKFVEIFERESKKAGKEQYLIPLFISNYPGCGAKEMKCVDDYLASMRWSPQQVQDFIPLPMTMAAAMYVAGKSPDGRSINVNRGLRERRPQIKMLKRKRHAR
jgi:uncharacterized radical SAM protein YgiQ